MNDLSERLKEDKVTFFSGAGFSKYSHGQLPLMAQLSISVLSKLRKRGGIHYEYVLNLLREDFENALTWLSTEWPWDNSFSKSEKESLYFEILKIIENDIGSSFISFKNDDMYRAKSFLSCLYQSDTFLTVNYDCIVEMANYSIYSSSKINKTSRDYGQDIVWSVPSDSLRELYSSPLSSLQDRRGGSFIMSTERGSFNYLKLHGSINWHRESKSDSRSEFFYSYPWVEYLSSSPNLQGLETYIVPPISNKSNITNNYLQAHLWQHSMRMLANSHTLIIMGYSLPITDQSIVHLFRHGFFNAWKSSKYPLKFPKKIFVVNLCMNECELEELKKRFVDSFKGEDINFELVSITGQPLEDLTKIMLDSRGVPDWEKLMLGRSET